jgi:PIN domain nuclease of toxin-antitoxin system
VSAILLDTHALLWFMVDDARTSTRAKRTIADTRREKIVSVLSLWEIAIKQNIGKLVLGVGFDAFVSDLETRDLTILPIRNAHLVAYAALPLHHRDPFDRMLVAQATVERCAIVTADPHFRAYDVDIVW